VRRPAAPAKQGVVDTWHRRIVARTPARRAGGRSADGGRVRSVLPGGAQNRPEVQGTTSGTRTMS
jgi:hypothetical protein